MVGLLEQAEDSIVTLPKPERTKLLREMRTARDWLNSGVTKRRRKRQAPANRAGKARAKKKGGTLRDARPLPGLEEKPKKRKS